MSDTEKMIRWHDGSYKFNIDSCNSNEIKRYLHICMEEGFQKEMDILDNELKKY